MGLSAPAFAQVQDNDVDAYDGTVDPAITCSTGPIPTDDTASLDPRTNNSVAGEGHCVEDGADNNDISGVSNTVGPF